MNSPATTDDRAPDTAVTPESNARHAKAVTASSDTEAGTGRQSGPLFRRFVSSKKAVLASVVAVAMIGSLAADAAIRQRTNDQAKDHDPNALIENLEYQTVVPEGKSISDLGGWKRVSPTKSDPVYAYVDSIDGVAISVSQQPLPKSKGGAGDQVADIAKRFNATAKIDANGTTVYLGTSAKGPQSAILTKNDLLILIKSQSKIDDKSWGKYAKSLN